MNTLTSHQLRATRLPAADWAAHRAHAQAAAADGFLAIVEQHFSNDASDPEPVTHTTHVLPPEAGATIGPIITDEEGPMGDTLSCEVFRPGDTLGHFGQRTPVEDMP